VLRCYRRCVETEIIHRFQPRAQVGAKKFIRHGTWKPTLPRVLSAPIFAPDQGTFLALVS
jgi:hypothetical protein